MILWLDNHLPPALASWMRTALDVECLPVRDLNLQRASDIEIFMAARVAGTVVATKDADVAALVGQHGPPPQIVFVTCGNTSNARLREVVEAGWATVRSMLERGEPLWSSANSPDRRPRVQGHQAARWRASTLSSQTANRFQLAPLRSTNLPL